MFKTVSDVRDVGSDSNRQLGFAENSDNRIYDSENGPSPLACVIPNSDTISVSVFDERPGRLITTACFPNRAGGFGQPLLNRASSYPSLECDVRGFSFPISFQRFRDGVNYVYTRCTRAVRVSVIRKREKRS